MCWPNATEAMSQGELSSPHVEGMHVIPAWQVPLSSLDPSRAGLCLLCVQVCDKERDVRACRKRKLLEKQKEGKARMRRVGSVDLPQAVFHSLMRT